MTEFYKDRLENYSKGYQQLLDFTRDIETLEEWIALFPQAKGYRAGELAMLANGMVFRMNTSQVECMNLLTSLLIHKKDQRQQLAEKLRKADAFASRDQKEDQA